MKIKSIAAICKKNKNIAIFERYSDDGDILTQYIGDGSAVYPVIGLPPLNAGMRIRTFREGTQRARSPRPFHGDRAGAIRLEC